MDFVKVFGFGGGLPYSSSWEDIMRHTRQPFKGGGKMTEAHETTHGIHADLRNRAVGTRVNAFYVLDDRAIYFPEPDVTIADVAARVPKKARGEVFDLYMVKSRKHWNRNPLYILDEMVAYTNGAIVGKEEGDDGWQYECARAQEMTKYAWYLILEIEARQPEYADLQKLVEFVNWNNTRNPMFGVKLL